MNSYKSLLQVTYTRTNTHADTLESSHSLSFTITLLARWTWHAANRQRMGLGGPTQTGGWHQLERERGGGRRGRFGLWEIGRQRDTEAERVRDDRRMCRPHRIENGRVKSLVKDGYQTNTGSDDKITFLHSSEDLVVLTRPSMTVQQRGLCLFCMIK